MSVHILGIGGTFMGGLAVLARELNLKVSGCDQNMYPPMSTQLENLGIEITQGFSETQLQGKSSELSNIVVGNVMTRGMPVIEWILNQRLPMMSGPEWLAKYVLQNKIVLAVAGTHGKTTTTSMLAWILEYAGLNPGFLIGGIPQNFSASARLGGGKYFVVEADEYDSAFFDKRSKFIHYRPNVLIINNLEYDHADIFPNLAAIQTQFHHLIRTIPNQGKIIYPKDDNSIAEVLEKGCWTPKITTGFNSQANYYIKNENASGSEFEVYCRENLQGESSESKREVLQGKIEWSLIGQHNMLNALSAVAAAAHVGIPAATAIAALSQFKGVKRRLELKGTVQNIKVYDDFAHHPTAIKTTLKGVRASLKTNSTPRIIAVIDLRSNTMKAGHHAHELPEAVQEADSVYFYKVPDISWDVKAVWQASEKPGGVFSDIQELQTALSSYVRADDQIIFMSNGGFSNIQTEFLRILKEIKF